MDDREETGLRVASKVPVQLVVVGPEQLKRRHRKQQPPVRGEQIVDVAERAPRILDVLEHVEHDDEIVTPTRRKRVVERTDLDPLAPRRLIGHDAGVGLDAFDLPELAEKRKQHAIAAADVEDGGIAAAPEQTSANLAYGIVARPPPPVAGRQITVALGVRRVHAGLRSRARR